MSHCGQGVAGAAAATAAAQVAAHELLCLLLCLLCLLGLAVLTILAWQCQAWALAVPACVPCRTSNWQFLMPWYRFPAPSCSTLVPPILSGTSTARAACLGASASGGRWVGWWRGWVDEQAGVHFAERARGARPPLLRLVAWALLRQCSRLRRCLQLYVLPVPMHPTHTRPVWRRAFPEWTRCASFCWWLALSSRAPFSECSPTSGTGRMQAAAPCLWQAARYRAA